MLKITKQQLQDLFEGTKTWEEMATEFSAEANLKVTSKMVQDLFKQNGFNLKSRSRKKEWFTVIDDTSPSPVVETVTETVPTETEQYA